MICVGLRHYVPEFRFLISLWTHFDDPEVRRVKIRNRENSPVLEANSGPNLYFACRMIHAGGSLLPIDHMQEIRLRFVVEMKY